VCGANVCLEIPGSTCIGAILDVADRSVRRLIQWLENHDEDRNALLETVEPLLSKCPNVLQHPWMAVVYETGDEPRGSSIVLAFVPTPTPTPTPTPCASMLMASVSTRA
jgi:hypothetical protein